MSQVMMIRGVRNEADAEYEKKVMLYNKKQFGIDKYLYLFSNSGFEQISSSKTRELAENLELEELSNYVSPLVISKLLEKVLRIRNLFMVVGRPGTGKSTFLKMLSQEDKNNVYIDTDQFNQALKPLLKEKFGNSDLIKIALTREEDLKKIIAKPWISLLKKALKNLPQDCNAFVEIPIGLQSDKMMFRFVGVKVIHLGCDDNDISRLRVILRKTPELLPFIERIPNWE